MRRRAKTLSPRWPFWLLIVAWVCANSPQAATYALLTWIADARQFSHQQQLARDVAHLLVGEKAPERPVTVVAAATGEEEKSSRAKVPATAVVKKIDLSSEERVEGVWPGARVAKVVPQSDRWVEALRAPPPHGPPRATALI